MIVLYIILTILKIILYIILALLGVVLTITTVILFVPIKYDCEVEVIEKKFNVYFKVRWLFNVIKCNYFLVDEKSSVEVKIFGFKIGARKEKKQKKDKTAKKSEPKNVNDNNINIDTKIEKLVETEIPEKVEKLEKKTVSEVKEKANQDEESDDSEGIFNKNTDILNMIKYVYNYPDRNKIINYTFVLLKRLLLAVKPKYFKITGEIGLDDPATTGKLLGGLYVSLCSLGIEISIKGNFEKKMLKLVFSIKDDFSLWDLLYPLLAYIVKKPIWKIAKKYIFRKGDKNE